MSRVCAHSPRAVRRVSSCTERRGAMLPLIAFLLPVMAIFLGFAVDLAYMQTTRMELRAAADVSARAAASKLSRTDDVAEAIATAKSIASQNLVAGAPLVLADSDIEVGRSAPDSSGKWVFSPTGFPPNSVRVLGRRTSGSPGGVVPLFFSTLIGSAPFEPQQTATASFLNVDICLVLDRSTSMKLNADSSETGMYTSDSRFCSAPRSNSRWAALDDAVRVFVDELDDTEADEQVGLATYSSGLSGYCGTNGNASRIDSWLNSDLTQVTDAMDSLLNSTWNGNTNIEAGMRDGVQVLTDPARSRDYADKVMIVMTDGYENEGSAASAAGACVSNNIVAHTITFGDYADRVSMANVATSTGGRHYHASDSDSLRAVFRELAAQLARLTE
ncbi:MAG: VWA domain-containing protein [Planctomycetales bacterium]|nr:VWA domain-containing protein [Planctomycetales bacterium]